LAHHPEDWSVAPPGDEWGAPAALVEEFRAPIEQPATPMKATPVIEETHVPGSILDLRPTSPKPRGEGGTPVVHTPVTPPVVEQEPEPYVESAPSSYVMPEPTYVRSEPTYVRPEPTYVMPEPTYVKSEPSDVRTEPFDSAQDKPALVKPDPPVPVTPEPAAIVKPPTANASAPAATTSGHSASFEAALAAIRAAWAKPEPTASTPEPQPTVPARPAPTATGNVRQPGGSGEVDLSNEIDSLEDLGDGTAHAADELDSPDGSTTPNGRRKTEKPTKRQEKPRGRKMQGADGRDEWGVFDPNQCEFSTLVNTLDEVTDPDEPTPRTNLR
jgi:hypothetical protein